MAQYAEQKKDYTSAEFLYTKALKSCKSDTNASQAVLFNLGLIHIHQKDYKKAIGRFEKLLLLVPFHIQIINKLVEIYAILNLPEKSISLLESAMVTLVLYLFFFISTKKGSRY